MVYILIHNSVCVCCHFKHRFISVRNNLLKSVYYTNQGRPLFPLLDRVCKIMHDNIHLINYNFIKYLLTINSLVLDFNYPLYRIMTHL